MLRKLLVIAALAGFVGACSTPPSQDYSRFYSSNPRSIVVVPVINHTNDAEASNLFLSTLAIPLAERGYYVFPTNMVKDMMEREGLSDPYLVHQAPTPHIAQLFGADAVLYVEIINWKSTYAVIATGIKVEFIYTLKDGRNGAIIWQHQREYFHDQSTGSGNIFVDLIATAIVAAVESSRSDYTPVAVNANLQAIAPAGMGLPFGPYSPDRGSNAEQFKATGDGNLSNASWSAVSAGGTGLAPRTMRGEEPAGLTPQGGQGASQRYGSAEDNAVEAQPSPIEADSGLGAVPEAPAVEGARAPVQQPSQPTADAMPVGEPGAASEAAAPPAAPSQDEPVGLTYEPLNSGSAGQSAPSEPAYRSVRPEIGQRGTAN